MEDFNSKYSGEQVEQLLDQVASGNAGGGGGGITVETDPIFSASPAASITEEKIEKWDRSLETYVADFTMEDLMLLVGTEEWIQCNTPAIAAAMEENKVILVRESNEDEFKGFSVLNGFIEDLLYFSVITSTGNVIVCIGNDYTEQILYGGNLELLDWNNFVTYNRLKTINGESIVGSGDITIEGGTGGVGPQGPQGEQGPKGEDGEDGVGIASVKQTTTSTADGGTNVVTVTLSNGTTSTFNVKNGSKGSSGTNGTNGANGKDGADGDDGATFTPSVDSAGNLSWTNNKGLTNPPTVNIKGPKGDKGDAGEGDGDGVNTPRYIQWDDTVLSFSGPEPMTPNVTYVCTRPLNSIYLDEMLSPDDSWHGGVTDLYNEYSVIFESNDVDIYLPDNFIWANGVIPTLENGVRYELSIALMRINNKYIAHAVLTPFKPLE